MLATLTLNAHGLKQRSKFAKSGTGRSKLEIENSDCCISDRFDHDSLSDLLTFVWWHSSSTFPPSHASQIHWLTNARQWKVGLTAALHVRLTTDREDSPMNRDPSLVRVEPLCGERCPPPCSGFQADSSHDEGWCSWKLMSMACSASSRLSVDDLQPNSPMGIWVRK